MEGYEAYLGSHRDTLESTRIFGNLKAYLVTWLAGKPTWATIGSWGSMEVVLNPKEYLAT